MDLNSYFEDYVGLIKPEFLFDALEELKIKILETKSIGGKLVFLGNGASSAIASHAALDFTKQAKVRAITFHDPALITAYVNDFGGENWLREICRANIDKQDLVLFVSVSGESTNLIKAAKWLREQNIDTVSFTGRNKNNTLGSLTNQNLWVNSHAYNIVECIHMIWITTVIDMVLGKKVYSVN
jgi:D-sedoheptulose 7-phosphate isomerase